MNTVSAVGGLAAWTGSDIASADDWVYELDDVQTSELLRVVSELTPLRLAGGLRAVVETQCAELERSTSLFADIRAQLADGRGLALVRGLPVAELSVEELETLTWCIGCQIGVPIHQNPQRDVIVHVRDEGKDFARLDVRAYETATELNYHSDSSDVVGLLCVRPARSGGVSTVVSATRIHDEVAARDPQLATLLYEPWWHYNPANGDVRQRPICVRLGDKLYTHYGRRYLDLGAADSRTPDVTPQQRALLDLWDEFAHRPDLVLNMDFQPGDLQLLNNFSTLHSRTAYQDHSDPAQRRHLCRVWLVLPEQISPPPEFEDVGIIPRNIAFS